MRPALLHAIASILLAACSCRPPVPAGTPAGDSCLSEPAETALLQTTRIGGRPRADTGLQRNAPQPDQVAKSVAVVLRGKAFREGRQHNTAVAKDPAQQLFATQSQIVNLVLPLESAGFSVHVFSATYTCKHTHSLVEKWSGRLRADVRTATEGSSQSINAWDAVSAALDYASKHSLNFTIAAVLRHDMILKKNIGKMIVKKYEQGGHKFKKFLVPFKMIKKFRFWPDRVPDTIQIMSGPTTTSRRSPRCTRSLACARGCRSWARPSSRTSRASSSRATALCPTTTSNVQIAQPHRLRCNTHGFTQTLKTTTLDVEDTIDNMEAKIREDSRALPQKWHANFCQDPENIMLEGEASDTINNSMTTDRQYHLDQDHY